MIEAPTPAATQALPPTMVQLRNLRPGIQQLVIGVVTYSFHTPKSVRNGEFMFILSVIDPSLNIANNEKIAVYMFTKNPDNLPAINSLGDIIVLRRFRYLFHGMQAQLKGNIGESAFVLVPKQGNREDSLKRLSPSERSYVDFLNNWFNEGAEEQVRRVDPQTAERWKAPNLTGFVDELMNGVPLVRRDMSVQSRSSVTVRAT